MFVLIVRHAISLFKAFVVFKVHVLVFDVAGANVVHPAVEMQHLLVAPRVLHNSGLGEVENLLLYILFHKSIPSLLLVFDSV
jgi:hypothetical protein